MFYPIRLNSLRFHFKKMTPMRMKLLRKHIPCNSVIVFIYIHVPELVSIYIILLTYQETIVACNNGEKYNTNYENNNFIIYQNNIFGTNILEVQREDVKISRSANFCWHWLKQRCVYPKQRRLVRVAKPLLHRSRGIHKFKRSNYSYQMTNANVLSKFSIYQFV